MKRAIKFRAWDIEDKKYWTAGFSIDCDTGGIYDDCERYWDSSEVIVEQFTGLVDKNGKEIYENDVIETKFGVINKISWYQSGWIFHNPVENPNALIRFSDNPGIENEIIVVGNIHEQPELITKP